MIARSRSQRRKIQKRAASAREPSRRRSTKATTPEDRLSKPMPMMPSTNASDRRSSDRYPLVSGRAPPIASQLPCSADETAESIAAVPSLQPSKCANSLRSTAPAKCVTSHDCRRNVSNHGSQCLDLLETLCTMVIVNVKSLQPAPMRANKFASDRRRSKGGRCPELLQAPPIEVIANVRSSEPAPLKAKNCQRQESNQRSNCQASLTAPFTTNIVNARPPGPAPQGRKRDHQRHCRGFPLLKRGISGDNEIQPPLTAHHRDSHRLSHQSH